MSLNSGSPSHMTKIEVALTIDNQGRTCLSENNFYSSSANDGKKVSFDISYLTKIKKEEFTIDADISSRKKN